ncbi:MAG TPA: hypothetical protein PKD16_19580 [Saprospiraceae bacterium]|jgi:hypothetical protein|nr:hypothetical protein [Saprospiraceae bacterium]HMT72376.1 hypothetical protein [Saprospiraceae bacterium]
MKLGWYRVLQHFENKHYIENGLTLPFLCGINTELLNENEPLTITEFVDMVISNKPEINISILKCPKLGEYVFGILDKHSIEVYKMYLSKGNEIYTRIENFYITDGSIQGVGNLDALIRLFNEKYEDKINNREFSKINGTWQEYSEKDKKRINECK